MYRIYFLFILCFSGASLCFSQTPAEKNRELKIKLSGKILEKEDGESVPYVHIINKNTKEGTTSDLSGDFSISISSSDTLIFSAVGFKDYIFTFSKTKIKSSNYFIKIALDYSTLQLAPVTIFAFKDEAAFKNDILNLDLPDSAKKIVIPGSFEGTPVPAKTKVYLNHGLACNGCITSFLNVFNKAAKENKKLRKAVAELPRQREIYEKYNSEIVEKITGLKEGQLNEFMLFCEISVDYILMANEYEIASAVNGCYKEFLKIRD